MNNSMPILTSVLYNCSTLLHERFSNTETKLMSLIFPSSNSSPSLYINMSIKNHADGRYIMLLMQTHSE